MCPFSERTALRAGIRNLESELESANLAKRIMDHENDKLRKIISTYIQSSDFSQVVWDIMKDEDFSTAPKTDDNSFANSSFKGKKSLSERGSHDDSHPSKPQQELGFRRRDIVDSGKNNLKILNRLDVELNEILSNVLKEKNRQRLLMKDLMRLINKNKEMFTAPDEDAPGPLARGTSKKFRRNSMINLGGLNKANIGSDGIDIAIQTDQKDEYGAILARPGEDKPVDISVLGVAPLAPSHVVKAGADVPYLIRRRMTSFPKVLRVPPAVWTYQTILSIYFDKIQDDDERKKKGQRLMTLSDYVHHYFVKTLGLATAADTQVSLLLKACEAHGHKQSRITIFASQIGLVSKDEDPPMDIRDTGFLLGVIRQLTELGELVSDSQKANKGKMLAHSAVYIRPDISRSAAINVIQQTFEKWLPDGGEDYMIKVRSMQHSELGQKFVVRLFIYEYILSRSNS
ncbi:hypothetical protein EON65_08770 [archaeon]|nr:MAG: hypothetical protein EON65_08770 [archaeon]